MTLRALLCFTTLTALSGCGADEDPNSGRRPGVMNSAAGSGATAGTGSANAGSGTAAVPSGASGFGNSAEPPTLLPDLGLDAEECVEATIAFVVDGSGSMCETFGAGTRWSELRTALLEPANGLLYRLQGYARFGMLIYDGSISLDLLATATGGTMSPACAGGGGRLDAMGCMQMREVAAQLNNAQAIDNMFPRNELGGSTPTDLAMKYQVDQLIAAQDAGQNILVNPQYIILATDGAPNSICVGGVGGDSAVQQAAVGVEVDRAMARGIKTFVISLAGADAMLQAHLDDIARRGDPMNPMARTYNPSTPQDLVSSLTLLVGNALGCNVE